MARKVDYISKLAEETARDITKNGEEWRRYLNTAARCKWYNKTSRFRQIKTSNY